MRNAFGWSVLSVVLMSGLASAQAVRPGVPGRPAQPGVVPAGGQIQSNQIQSNQSADQQIAAIIAGCNRNEVEIAKFALPKLESSEAKEIATMLIKDHTAAADKFAKWAGQAPNANSGARPNGSEGAVNRAEGQREERREEVSERAQTNPATAPNNPANSVRTALKPATSGGLNWLAVHQEIGEECLASCKKELSRYEGNEFDKAFLGHQIAGHMKAAVELKVFRRHVSSQLATEIDDALATTEDHLKQIRETMDEKKEEKSDSKKRSE